MKGYKTGGRQAGTPNQITASIKQVISEALISEAQNLPTLLESLPPKDRIYAFTKLAALIVPNEPQIDNFIWANPFKVEVIDTGYSVASSESEIID
jgi:hypothetical protein